MIASKRTHSLAALVLTAATLTAGAAEVVTINIPSGDLAAALELLAKQSGIELVFRADQVTGLHTAGLTGTLRPKDAVEKLLEGTRFKLQTDESTGALLIIPARKPVADSGGDSNASDAMRLTQAGSNPSGALISAADNGAQVSGTKSDKPIEEIIVTAQKRVERLQDVPVPVAVMNGITLANNNQLRLQEYYFKVPGLGLAVIGDGSAPAITIRGITTGGTTNPAVGIVIDDVPYGGTVTPGTTPTVPDIDPGDLARIEVLRGPQGTLYGASSIGGLLKFVTVDPSTEAVRGRLQAGFASVENGEVGHTLRGSINVPLSDEFAVRASAFTIRDPGYVDNVQTGQRDVNRRDSNGGRLSALWRPSDVFSLKLGALIQDSDRLGTSDIDTTLGGELQQTGIPGTGIYTRKSQAYSATMSVKLGSVDLVSVTGYNTDKTASALDASVAFGGFASPFGVSGLAAGATRDIEKLTQEIRVSFPVGNRIHWLLGAFYGAEDVDTGNLYLAKNSSTGAVAGTAYIATIPSTFDEYAAFTNLTFDVTERLDVQFGGRLSENKQTFAATRIGAVSLAFFGSDPSVVTEKTSKDRNVFTYMMTPRLKISSDIMVYARIASGFRPGGPNTGCGIATVPCEFDPDKTKNYEIGAKGSAFDGRLSFDASLYHIDWENIQLSLTIGGFGYQTNASAAKSQGVEFSVESQPVTGLTLSAWVAYDDAVLTEDFPSAATNVRGLAGDRLPYSSRFSGSFSLDQEFPLGDFTGFAGGSVSYVGERKGTFRSAAQSRETFPAYTQLDLRLGAKYNAWTVNAFLNNLTDERGILRSGVDSSRLTFLSYTQPRTVGLSLAREF